MHKPIKLVASLVTLAIMGSGLNACSIGSDNNNNNPESKPTITSKNNDDRTEIRERKTKAIEENKAPKDEKKADSDAPIRLTPGSRIQSDNPFNQRESKTDLRIRNREGVASIDQIREEKPAQKPVEEKKPESKTDTKTPTDPTKPIPGVVVPDGGGVIVPNPDPGVNPTPTPTPPVKTKLELLAEAKDQAKANLDQANQRVNDAQNALTKAEADIQDAIANRSAASYKLNRAKTDLAAISDPQGPALAKLKADAQQAKNALTEAQTAFDTAQSNVDIAKNVQTAANDRLAKANQNLQASAKQAWESLDQTDQQKTVSAMVAEKINALRIKAGLKPLPISPSTSSQLTADTTADDGILLNKTSVGYQDVPDVLANAIFKAWYEDSTSITKLISPDVNVQNIASGKTGDTVWATWTANKAENAPTDALTPTQTAEFMGVDITEGINVPTDIRVFPNPDVPSFDAPADSVGPKVDQTIIDEAKEAKQQSTIADQNVADTTKVLDSATAQLNDAKKADEVASTNLANAGVNEAKAVETAQENLTKAETSLNNAYKAKRAASEEVSDAQDAQVKAKRGYEEADAAWAAENSHING